MFAGLPPAHRAHAGVPPHAQLQTGAWLTHGEGGRGQRLQDGEARVRLRAARVTSAAAGAQTHGEGPLILWVQPQQAWTESVGFSVALVWTPLVKGVLCVSLADRGRHRQGDVYL